MTDGKTQSTKTRRDVLKTLGRVLGVSALGASGVRLFARHGDGTVWQIDPDQCTQCGRCATACVLSPSAVKCVHAYDVCGYCELCGGYHRPEAKETDTAAENQLCPTGAIVRTYVENPYYEYRIDEARCIGCAVCVEGCAAFGNGSLHLQIRHDRCVNCNACRIAEVCPANAIARIPAERPYRMKGAQSPLTLTLSPRGEGQGEG